MKWGEIWTQSGGPGYTGKPRPALIVQADWLIVTESIMTCGITGRGDHILRFRPPLDPSPTNGLHKPSEVMVDKIIAIRRDRLGQRLGAISEDDMERVGQALLLTLGFGG